MATRKRDLLNYYDAVAPLILPHLEGPPALAQALSQRHREAISSFKRTLPRASRRGCRTAVAEGIAYAVGDDRATLLFLVNLGCIDHNPWMSRMGSLEHPDYVLIDLDPMNAATTRSSKRRYGCGHARSRELESFPKTTGGDGMHVFVPLAPLYTYEQVRAFAEALSDSRRGRAARPVHHAARRARREKGKVYFDWQQIAEGKTISAPTSCAPTRALRGYAAGLG